MSMVEKMLKCHLKEVVTDNYTIELNMPKDYPAIDAPATEEGGVRERFFKAVAELPHEITVVRPFNVDAFEGSNKNTFYVSPRGNDNSDGSKDAPLKTISEALDRVRGLGGAKIVLMKGNHLVSETVRITSQHSGKVNSPLIITSEGEDVFISSSVDVPFTSVKPLCNEEIISHLPEAAKDKVMMIDLGELGLSEFGRFRRGGMISFMINGVPQKLSRYPKEGDAEIPKGKVYADPAVNPDGTCDEAWEVGFESLHALTWADSDTLVIYGSLANEWDRRYGVIDGINKEKSSVYSKTAFYPFRFGGNPRNSFYFANIIEELASPGECVVDYKRGKIYFYPDESFRDGCIISYAYKTCDIFSCEGVENVIFDRLDIGRCCGCVLRAKDCRQLLMQRCHVIGVSGEDFDDCEAVLIDNSFKSGIVDTVIEYFAVPAGGVYGGDRFNLIPGNNFIQNCKVINPLVRVGLSTGGCGNVISHNYSHNTTMGDNGHNEGIFEYNIVEGGDTEAEDTGIIYVGGGGCSSCANHYRYNYFFDFAKGDYGIYFDDLSRGMYAYGNIIVGNGTDPDDKTLWHGGGRSFNHHNGGEHCYWNNISIDAGYFAFGGDISYWLTNQRHWNGFFDGILDAATNMSRSKKYMDRNPTYKDYCKAVFRYAEDRKDPDYKEKSGQAERRLRANWCNHYENNLILRASRPYKLDIGLETATGLETNYITSEDVGFENEAERDYRLRADSVVFEKIPGFIAPPFEKMGPVDDFQE
ncbi:MAG: hypothetical protein IKM46_09035 [Clostridia bacterium]|nr:hypothetical protein [Clostridia bacterium]